MKIVPSSLNMDPAFATLHSDEKTYNLDIELLPARAATDHFPNLIKPSHPLFSSISNWASEMFSGMSR